MLQGSGSSAAHHCALDVEAHLQLVAIYNFFLTGEKFRQIPFQIDVAPREPGSSFTREEDQAIGG